MKITDILHKDSIAVHLKASSKLDLLNKMLELAVKSGNITDIDDARKEIIERERIMSTGVGKGIALPHAKTNSVKDSVGALAIIEGNIEYEALDGKPVNVVFLLLGRENNVGNHLRLLSKISRLLGNDLFKAQLLQSQSTDEIYQIFQTVEENE